MNLLRSCCLVVPSQKNFSVFLPKSGKVRRSSGLLGLAAALAALCLGSAGARAATCTVTSTNDSGAGTLRSCLTTYSSGDTIDITAKGTITLANALPAITNDVTITGPGANQLTISGGGSLQVFTIGAASPTVAISGLEISGGSAGAGSGGAINQGSGSLTVTACEFTNNSAKTGGAIAAGGGLTVSNSTFANNSAAVTGGVGGAIAGGSSTTLNVTNSTFYENSAAVYGGAFYFLGTLNVTNSTFSDNSASAFGGGITINGGTLTANNNIFSGNSSSQGGAGIYNAGGTANASYNVYFSNLSGGSEDDCNSCTTNSNATTASANPLTLPLINYGGTMRTLLPQPGSQAICAGSTSVIGLPTTDQRGFSMNPSYNPCTTAGSVDAGAVQSNYIQVQTGGDTGSGATDCEGSNRIGCTLRDAVALVNANGDIDFIGSVNIALSSTLELSGSGGINIVGPGGASTVTVDGGGSSSSFSVFTVDANVPALLYGLTISNGNSNTNGGGINNSGILTVLDSTISGNSATTYGGGIYNTGTLTLAYSTLSGNSANTGAGIYTTGGTLTVSDSTISGNTASDQGGGIEVNSGSAGLANAIVSGNAATNNYPDITAVYANNGGNVIGDTGAQIMLSPLQLNGIGATVQTMIPLPGSPATCAGTTANIVYGISADERSYPLQPTGGYCPSGTVDAGAVQTNYTSVNFVRQPSSVTLGAAMSPAPTANILETDTLLSSSNTDAVNGVPITLTYSGTGTLQNGNATTAAGVATFTDLDVITDAGTNVTLEVSVPVTPSGITPATTLTAASNDFNVNPENTTVTTTPAGAAITVDGSVTFTATVAPISGPPPAPFAGTMSFASNETTITGCSAQLVNPTTGVASCTTTTLLAGADKITATYSGDSNYNASPASSPTTQTVNMATPVFTSITPSATKANLGTTVTFTATITAPGNGVALGGSVTFLDNGSAASCTGGDVISVGNWNSANATATAVCSTSSMTAGTHVITATYASDPNYTDLTVPAVAKTVTVNSNTSGTVGLALSPSTSSTIDQLVSITISVPITPGLKLSGTPTLTDGGSAVAGCTLTWNPAYSSTAGQATCTTQSLAEGAHSFVAKYSDSDGNDPGNGTASYTVNTQPTTLGLASSPASSSTVNQSVTFSATISYTTTGPFTPTGTVGFKDSVTSANIPGCSAVPLSSATPYQANCTTASLALNGHTITAAYTGDTNFGNSNGTASISVSPANSSVALASSQNPAVITNQVTFTATVSPSNAAIPLSSSGTVEFKDSATNSDISGCSAVPITPATGVASCSTSTLAVGTHTITAIYANDPSYNTNSGTFSQIVNLISEPPLTLASSSTSQPIDQPMKFTATFSTGSTVAYGGGKVTFVDVTFPGDLPASCSSVAPTPSTGVGSITYTAICQSSVLIAGQHTIQATYSGDTNFTVGANGTSVTVTSAPTTISVVSSLNPSFAYAGNTTNYKDTVTFTATVTPATSSIPLSGSVTFLDNGSAMPGCSSVSFTSSGVANCTATALPSGTNNIAVTYSEQANSIGGQNYSSSSNTLSPAQTVEDYALTVLSPNYVFVGTGYASGSTANNVKLDRFFGQQNVTLTTTSVGTYAGTANLTCTPQPSAGAPACELSNSGLTIPSITSVAVVVDASASSVAPGVYSYTVTATDPTTGIVRTQTFKVIVYTVSSTLTVVSGATTGNSDNVTFELPAGVTLSNLSCSSVAGTGLSANPSASALGIGCTFSPVSPPSIWQVTVTTSGTVTAKNAPPTTTGKGSNLLLAALFGIPVFVFVGFRYRRKSFLANITSMLAIAALALGLFYSVGCSGSQNPLASKSDTTETGTTPPGSYVIQIQGTGSDGNTYQAALSLDVNL